MEEKVNKFHISRPLQSINSGECEMIIPPYPSVRGQSYCNDTLIIGNVGRRVQYNRGEMLDKNVDVDASCLRQNTPFQALNQEIYQHNVGNVFPDPDCDLLISVADRVELQRKCNSRRETQKDDLCSNCSKSHFGGCLSSREIGDNEVSKSGNEVVCGQKNDFRNFTVSRKNACEGNTGFCSTVHNCSLCSLNITEKLHNGCQKHCICMNCASRVMSSDFKICSQCYSNVKTEKLMHLHVDDVPSNAVDTVNGAVCRRLVFETKCPDSVCISVQSSPVQLERHAHDISSGCFPVKKQDGILFHKASSRMVKKPDIQIAQRIPSTSGIDNETKLNFLQNFEKIYTNLMHRPEHEDICTPSHTVNEPRTEKRIGSVSQHSGVNCFAPDGTLPEPLPSLSNRSKFDAVHAYKQVLCKRFSPSDCFADVSHGSHISGNEDLISVEEQLNKFDFLGQGISECAYINGKVFDEPSVYMSTEVTSPVSLEPDRMRKLPPPYFGNSSDMTAKFLSHSPLCHDISGNRQENVCTAIENGRDYPDVLLANEKPRELPLNIISSPKPNRKLVTSSTKERIRYYPAFFKLYMEQHVENVMKSYQQRLKRRQQLEEDMNKLNLSEIDRKQCRSWLFQKESQYNRLKRTRMSLSLFETITILGRGAFGDVTLVRRRDSGILYAVKTLKKKDILRQKQIGHVKAERDLLAEADTEWVVKLYYSFQDSECLYFVMEYVAGGDLMGLLVKMKIFSHQMAQFYTAELVLAVESVHQLGYIHRDIKPDNVLIDLEGHIKLTDFGLCTGFHRTHASDSYLIGQGEIGECEQKSQNQRSTARSLVGTPNYIAPEVLLQSGYNSCCDWWSVGIIVYEMLIGRPPFMSETSLETQLKVVHWRSTLHIPASAGLSSDASDFILGLLCDQDSRLGRNGADEIKCHAFFGSIEFENIHRQIAPYIPKISHPLDTSNFETVEPTRTVKKDDDETVALNDVYGDAKHAFLDFTFRRFFDDDVGRYNENLI